MINSRATEFQRHVERMRPRFVAMLSKRLDRIEANIGRLDEADRDVALEEIRFDIHKTAGAAAAFGFRELGKEAARTSRIIMSGIPTPDGQVSPDLVEEVKRFQSFLAEALSDAAA